MAKKNVTIDELAVMVQNGFAEITGDMATKSEMNKRFEQVDKRFDGVDKRLDGMVTKAEMNRRFDGLEDRVLASHQKRIEKLETEIKDLRALFTA